MIFYIPCIYLHITVLTVLVTDTASPFSARTVRWAVPDSQKKKHSIKIKIRYKKLSEIPKY